jgi:hypothetical protein
VEKTRSQAAQSRGTRCRGIEQFALTDPSYKLIFNVFHSVEFRKHFLIDNSTFLFFFCLHCCSVRQRHAGYSTRVSRTIRGCECALVVTCNRASILRCSRPRPIEEQMDFATEQRIAAAHRHNLFSLTTLHTVSRVNGGHPCRSSTRQSYASRNRRGRLGRHRSTSATGERDRS